MTDPDATWQTPAPGVFIAAINVTRGFTMHEHLDQVGLVHMGGRVYDPELGRFLSPDPFVQFAVSTQGFNRYAYVGNNPLSYTDPSGYFLKKLMKAAGIGMNFIPGWTLAGNAFIHGFVSGFLASGGDARAGMMGMLSAGIAGEIGLKDLNHFDRALAHGVTQGAISAAGGGRFGDGALGAFSGSLLSFIPEWVAGPYGSKDGQIGRMVAAAAVGGTVSKIGGGKFANGAWSAAFVSRFNHEEHSGSRDLRISDRERELAAAGEAEGFWRSRLKAGDPVARSALRSLGIKVNWFDHIPGFDFFFGGSSINNRLRAFSLVYGGGPLDVDLVRTDLMNAHVRAVDGDLQGVIGLLNPVQIARYHHDVFAQYRLPSTAFGGTPFGGTLGSSNTYRVFWCRGCDKQ